MQLRHISPRSSDWMDAMDEGGGSRGREKLTPEERNKLRQSARPAGTWGTEPPKDGGDKNEGGGDDYGWGRGSASR
jgi:hypothetical protein